jgi:hypothetical protein
MKVDKTLISVVLIFLTVLSEYPILFYGQPIAGQAIQSPIELPRMNVTIPPAPVPTKTFVPIPPPRITPLAEQTCIPVLLNKMLKDSRLWFSINVPDNWNATTEWEGGYGTWTGLYFYTNLGVEERVFKENSSALRINSSKIFIMTYTITKNQDQDYRNYYRENWQPVPVETVEKINGITFNRFESKGMRTAVAYVSAKTSANGRGYATLIRFVSSPPDCLEELEIIMHSFRYLSAREISFGSAPGVEISIPALE